MKLKQFFRNVADVKVSLSGSNYPPEEVAEEGNIRQTRDDEWLIKDK